MSTACSYNSAIGIKSISYWFTSCFLLAFPSVWIYPISPGVLPCSLAGRMNGLPPLLPFIWLFEGCGCHWALQPLHRWDSWDWEMGQKWASPAGFEGVLGFWHTFDVPLSPSSLLFLLLSEFGPCAGSAGWDSGWERSLSSAPTPPTQWLTLKVWSRTLLLFYLL